MEAEYKIVEGFGHYFNKRWELQKRYRYFAKECDEEMTEGWALECCGTKEFCEEALEKRLKDKYVPPSRRVVDNNDELPW